MGWIEYWDDKPTIYVNQRHREAHYRSVADGIIAVVAGDNPVVLDYGCGEALNAADVARRCRQLLLCDAAPNVRAELQRRHAADANIRIIAPEGLSQLAAGSVDLVVANSVIQYLSETDLDSALAQWLRLLAPNGRLLLADVIPPSIGPLTDATALLSFARREGFLGAAVAGLVRTFFSDYRKVRAALGLKQYDEGAMIALLEAKGFEAHRAQPNIGHNQARMAFVARPRASKRGRHD